MLSIPNKKFPNSKRSSQIHDKSTVVEHSQSLGWKTFAIERASCTNHMRTSSGTCLHSFGYSFGHSSNTKRGTECPSFLHTKSFADVNRCVWFAEIRIKHKFMIKFPKQFWNVLNPTISKRKTEMANVNILKINWTKKYRLNISAVSSNQLKRREFVKKSWVFAVNLNYLIHLIQELTFNLKMLLNNHPLATLWKRITLQSAFCWFPSRSFSFCTKSSNIR